MFSKAVHWFYFHHDSTTYKSLIKCILIIDPVILTSKNGATPFRGFLVQARRLYQQSSIRGTFINLPNNTHYLTCTGLDSSPYQVCQDQTQFAHNYGGSYYNSSGWVSLGVYLANPRWWKQFSALTINTCTLNELSVVVVVVAKTLLWMKTANSAQNQMCLTQMHLIN